MTERITRAQLEHKVSMLNRYLRRPEDYATKRDDGGYNINPGHITLESNSPGDGWTRYSVSEITNEGGGISPFHGLRVYSAREIDAYLDGMIAGIEQHRKLCRFTLDRAQLSAHDDEGNDTRGILRWIRVRLLPYDNEGNETR